MARKTSIQMEKEIGKKRVRSRVRLELAVFADRILNDLVPDFEEEYELATADGNAFVLESYDDWIKAAVAKRVTFTPLYALDA